jgi:hypothetical protein
MQLNLDNSKAAIRNLSLRTLGSQQRFKTRQLFYKTFHIGQKSKVKSQKSKVKSAGILEESMGASLY